MLDRFEPTKLHAELRRLAKVHTTRLDSLVNGEDLEESEVARRLMEKLRSTPDAELPRLLRSLKRLELRFVASLVAAEDAVVRHKALRICFQRPELARARPLWAVVNRYVADETAQLAANLLAADHRLREDLHPLQLEVCIGRRTSPLKAASAYWQHVATHRSSFSDSMTESDFVIGSSLHDRLGTYAMQKAPADTWDFLSESEFRLLFDDLRIESKVRTFLHGHEIFQFTKSVDLVQDAKVQFLLALLKRRTDLQEAVGELSREAMNWYRGLWSAYELISFFDEVPDSERFEFWKEYLPLLHFVEGDAANMRLFLDFGPFGIIEFAEVGNASYVYEREYFLKMLERNRRRQVHHGSLKSRSRALKTLNHSKRWQSRFRTEIENLLWRYR